MRNASYNMLMAGIALIVKPFQSYKYCATVACFLVLWIMSYNQVLSRAEISGIFLLYSVWNQVSMIRMEVFAFMPLEHSQRAMTSEA